MCTPPGMVPTPQAAGTAGRLEHTGFQQLPGRKFTLCEELKTVPLSISSPAPRLPGPHGSVRIKLHFLAVLLVSVYLFAST